jgi:nickel-responsive transcriptional regulator NikR
MPVPHIDCGITSFPTTGSVTIQSNKETNPVQRITITTDDELLAEVDGLMARRGYASRSEAVRDIVRDMGDRRGAETPKSECIAALSYVFEHGTRDLASRLTDAHHEHQPFSREHARPS